MKTPLFKHKGGTMDTRQIIIKEYKYLIKIKKTIMMSGIIASLSLLFTFYVKDKSMLLMILGGAITFCTLVLFLLLWISIPNIKKHILELTEKC